MNKMFILAISAIFLGIAGCDQGAEDAGEQIEKAVENASDAALDAAKRAGNKVEQWTDEIMPGEEPRNEKGKTAHQRASER